MIWYVSVALFVVGLVVWLAGASRGQVGIAVIGAILVLGVGGTVVVDGLEVEAGQIETVDNNTTTVEPTYQTAQIAEVLPLGSVVLILGGVMLIQALTEVL